MVDPNLASSGVGWFLLDAPQVQQPVNDFAAGVGGRYGVSGGAPYKVHLTLFNPEGGGMPV